MYEAIAILINTLFGMGFTIYFIYTTVYTLKVGDITDMVLAITVYISCGLVQGFLLYGTLSSKCDLNVILFNIIILSSLAVITFWVNYVEIILIYKYKLESKPIKF